MEVFERRFRVAAPLSVVRRFHGDPRALTALTPPPMRIRLHRFGAMEEGMEAEFTLWLGPLPLRWLARHEAVGEDGFTDVQVEGPMAHWRHRHQFTALGSTETEVHDRIEYAHPGGARGLGTRMLFSRAGLSGLFVYRAWATRRGCARRWAAEAEGR